MFLKGTHYETKVYALFSLVTSKPRWYPGMFVIFVSHQWLSSVHPDPSGHQAAERSKQGLIPMVSRRSTWEFPKIGDPNIVA